MPRVSEYLSIKDAAEYLGVAHNTPRNWGRDDRPPQYGCPANNYRLFKVSDFDKLLKKTGQSATRRNRKPR